MLDMIDDQARAFFNVVVGATWLFTGQFMIGFDLNRVLMWFKGSVCEKLKGVQAYGKKIIAFDRQ